MTLNQNFKSLPIVGIVSVALFGIIPYLAIGRGIHAEIRHGFSILVLVVQVVLLLMSIYQLLISLSGMVTSSKREPLNRNHLPRFLCVTAAHNEENVIGAHVKNMLSMNYPRDKFEVVILADNCIDDTMTIASSLGATVWERFNSFEKGKGYALRWAIHERADLKDYDAVCIFDADNLVEPNFLEVMATELQDGKVAIQGYLDTKNPWDSWITASYASAYWYMNRFWQRARTRIGLSGALGGTGFCLSTNLLESVPWEAMSLTEDLEYTVRLILSGTRVHWTDATRVYDEKPLNLSATIPQRTRWMQGHWNTAFRYSLPLLKLIFTRKPSFQSIRAMDSFLYLWQPVLILLTGFTLILSFTQVLYGAQWFTPFLASVFPHSLWIDFVIVGFLYPLVAFALEDASWKSFLYFPMFILFNLTWIPITIEGMVNFKSKVWSHTQHTRKMDLDAMVRE